MRFRLLAVCTTFRLKVISMFVLYLIKNGTIMKLNIKPGDLSKPKEWDGFVHTLNSRMSETDHFEVDMENLSELDLAHFNAMIMVYVKMRRMNKRLSYHNLKSATLRNLVSKTHFYHVFSK